MSNHCFYFFQGSSQLYTETSRLKSQVKEDEQIKKAVSTLQKTAECVRQTKHKLDDAQSGNLPKRWRVKDDIPTLGFTLERAQKAHDKAARVALQLQPQVCTIFSLHYSLSKSSILKITIKIVYSQL